MTPIDQARVGRTLSVVFAVTVTLTACQSQDRVTETHAPPGELPTGREAGAMLGLSTCQVVRRAIDPTPGQRISVVMPIDGRSYAIELEPHSVRAAGYQVLVPDAGGAVTARAAGPVRTLRGTVRWRPGCDVAGALLEDGLHLMVRLEDGRRCWMEPLPMPPAESHAYAVYDERHILPSGGVCETPGADGAAAIDDEAAAIDDDRAGPILVAQIACDTDTEFVTTHGSVEAAEARINAIINAVNLQYEGQVGIRHEITTIVIRTASDPYTATDAQDRLCQFIQEWNANHTDIERDVAHLFTDADLRGGTIGIAADIGGTGICVSQGGCSGGPFGPFGSFCIAQSDFGPGFSCVTDLTAHELGHLWGAFHCSCPSSTMNPGITCTNTFSELTIGSILRYRDTRECLEADDEPEQG